MRDRTRSTSCRAVIGSVVVSAALLATCWSGLSVLPAGAAQGGTITAVGAENEYANVIGQIGGRYVSVTAVMSNPNTDPHTFESSPRVAEVVTKAQLVVQNGLGYDGFMTKIEQAAPKGGRRVIDVQSLLRLPDSTPNPHLWYKPTTMPAVAKAIGTDLSAIDPAKRSYFMANVAAFDASLQPWLRAIATLRSTHPGAPVATTEPVADYMLQAASIDNTTPFTFQADIMNGVDPSPQDVAFQDDLFTNRKVKAFVYNQQVTDTLTTSLVQLAHQHHIPVVGVYETMPTPGYDYQTWMLAEVKALTNALTRGVSAPKL